MKTNRKVASLAGLAAVAGILFLAGPRSLSGQSLCQSQGYAFVFFNGVANTPDAALSNLYGLRTTVMELDSFGRDEYGRNLLSEEPIVFELFYNHTGSSVNARVFQDFAETFMQASTELDPTGLLGGRMEFLWEIMADGNRMFWDALGHRVDKSDDLFNAIASDIVDLLAEETQKLIDAPPTQEDYAEHNTRLKSLSLQGQKLLLVAHSQGNLFLNQAYDHILPDVLPESIKAVHIAPASPTTRGEHLLAEIDLVINALAWAPPVNLWMLPSVRDWSGHELIGTYLDPNRSGRARVKTLMESALLGLVTPIQQASIGFFTITLTWDGPGDVDLHAFEPDAGHVYYANREGNSGFLDMDNVTGYGPEHYYASCNAEFLQTGTYRIGINNYSRAEGVHATVQAASAARGVLKTVPDIDVGPVMGYTGNLSPIPVLDVVVSKDAWGAYSVRIE